MCRLHQEGRIWLWFSFNSSQLTKLKNKSRLCKKLKFGICFQRFKQLCLHECNKIQKESNSAFVLYQPRWVWSWFNSIFIFWLFYNIHCKDSLNNKLQWNWSIGSKDTVWRVAKNKQTNKRNQRYIHIHKICTKLSFYNRHH